MTGRLAGKTALITGSSSGQGRAAALRFAAEGAIVVGCARDPEPADETVDAVRSAGGRMFSLSPIDLSDEQDVVRWIEFALRSAGDFDILYNNASACYFAPIEEMTLEQWNYTLANELTLIFLAIKHSVPVFRRRGAGVILNTASVAGLRPSIAGGFAHCVTKTGVIALTESLAVELAPFNVRVNTVSPGFVETPGVASQLAKYGRAAVEAATLNHRVGQPDDVASAAVFMCSDDSVHITGANLAIDGGEAVAPGRGRAPAEPIRHRFN